MQQLDIIIISGEIFTEITSNNITNNKTRLQIDNIEASSNFLIEYFSSENNSAVAIKKLKEKFVFPFISLNGMLLKQYLKKYNYNAEVIEIFSFEKNRLKELLTANPSCTVLISTTFLPHAGYIEEIAHYIKKLSPETFIIAGGIKIWKSYLTKFTVDFNLYNSEELEQINNECFFLKDYRETPIDLFIVNEKGLQTLIKVLHNLKNSIDIRGINNTAFYTKKGLQINKIIQEPLESEIIIDWSQFSFLTDGKEFPVQTSSGCAYRCDFCDFHGLTKLHHRSINSLINELKTIPIVNGFRNVFFTDDNLFGSLKRARQICKAVINENLNLKWRSFSRVSIINDEIAEYFQRSGCKEILLGVEWVQYKKVCNYSA